MPIGRGETIGDAWVRIHADGSTLPQEIRDELHKDDGTFEDAGAEHSDAYWKGYKSQTEKKDVLGKSWDDIVDRARGRMEAAGDKSGSDYMRGLEQKLKDDAGDELGGIIAARLRNDLIKGARFADIQKEVRTNYHGLLEDAIGQIRSAEQQQAKDNDDWERNWRKTTDNIVADAQRAIAGGRKAVDDWDRNNTSLFNSLFRLGGAFDSLFKKQQTFDVETERNSHGFRRFVAGLGTDSAKLGASMDKAFGTRNPFMTFLGNILSAGPKLIGMLAGVSSEGDSAAKSLSGAGNAGSGFGSILAAGAAGAAALGVALAGLIIVVGPLISLLSGLLGIIVALAGSVVFAAAGAIAALAGAMVPLALGGAAVILAFGKLGQQGGAVHKVMNELKKDMSDLAAAARSGLDVGTLLPKLHGVIASLVPLLHAAGVGMHNFFDQILSGEHSAAFHAFLDAWTKVLPSMLRTVGNIAGNVLSGMAGLLRALIPLAQEFLGWLAGVTGEFSRWANSRAGQAQISDFLSRAAQSAQDVGFAIEQAIGLLGDLANAGKSAGDSMFRSLGNAIQNFRNFITQPILVHAGSAGRPDPTGELAKPETTTRLAQWVGFAKQLATELGNAAVDVGKLIADLDDKRSRDNLLAIVNLLDQMLALSSGIISFWDQGITFWLGIARGVGGAISAVGRFFSAAYKGLSGWASAIGHFFSDLGNRLHTNLAKDFDIAHWFGLDKGGGPAMIITAFAGLGPRIVKAIGKVNVSGIITGVASAVGSLLSPFVGMAGRILGRISPVNVSGIISGAANAVGNLLGAFAGMAGRILDRIAPVNVSGIISGAAQAASNLVSAFSGLASRIVDAIGTIVPHISIQIPSIPHLHLGAAGGLFSRATPMIIGEAGTEALVPLDRPLSQVDPAVRWLSAIAQGLTPAPGSSTGVSGRSVSVQELHVHAPVTDPYVAAAAVVDRLAAVGYF